MSSAETGERESMIREERGEGMLIFGMGGQRERKGWCYQIGKSMIHIHGRGRTHGALIQKYCIF